MSQSGFRVALLQGNTGGSHHGFGNGTAVPCGLAVLIVGFRGALLFFQNQTQKIVWVAGLGVHIKFCQGIKTLPGIAFRLGQTPHLAAVFCHAQQAVCMVGVALQSFQPVGVRHDSRVTVLLHMDTGEIQLVSTANLGCQRHGIFDGRLFQVIRLFLPVTGNRFSAGGDGNGNAALRAGPREHNGRCRVQRHLLRQDGLIAAGDLNMGVTKGFRSLNPDMLRLQRQGAFQVRVVRRADLLNGIPVLGKFLGLIGFQPGKIGLVIGVGACHQLGILAVGIGQSILPCLGQLIVRPSEHFLAGGDVVVADVDDAAV